MADKLPAFQLFTGDWLKDPNLGQCSSGTRGIWIDMLCLMHENGRSGELTGTVQGLAQVCRTSAEDMARALQELKDTGTGEIIECHGKVTVRNRRMYREAQERKSAADRKKRQRSRERHADGHADVTQQSQLPLGTVPQESRSLSSISDIEGDRGIGRDPAYPEDQATREIPGAHTKRVNGHAYREQARELLGFLNERAGRNFPATDTNLQVIVARLKEGFTVPQCKAVIIRRCKKWKGTEFHEYLRPATLFGRTKFHQYVGEVGTVDEQAEA